MLNRYLQAIECCEEDLQGLNHVSSVFKIWIRLGVTILRYEDAVLDFLTALETKDMDAFAGVWAEDAVQDMPYSPEGFPKRVSGKKNILDHYAGWPENSGSADFTSELIYYPMKNPEMIFVEFKGDVDIIPTGRKYLQTYGGLFYVEDGKIKLFREYYDPELFSYAFGLNESDSKSP